MILFWTDPAAPGGWSRLERSIELGVHLAPRKMLRFALPRNREAEAYASRRRLITIPHERMPGDLCQSLELVIFDAPRQSGEAAALAAACRERKIPVLTVRDPGDPAADDGDGLLGSWPPREKNDAPPGPAWAILHPRFRHFHRLRRTHPRRVRNVLVHLEDRLNFRHLSDLVGELWRRGYRLRIGPLRTLRNNLKRALGRKFPGIRWVGAPDCMARPLYTADTVLMAPGAAAMEAAAVGTPALYLADSPAEREAAARLENLGIGRATNTPWETLETLDADIRMNMDAAGRELVDARGLFRTVEFLKREGYLPASGAR